LTYMLGKNSTMKAMLRGCFKNRAMHGCSDRAAAPGTWMTCAEMLGPRGTSYVVLLASTSTATSTVLAGGSARGPIAATVVRTVLVVAVNH
jgi:hypothetical protein